MSAVGSASSAQFSVSSVLGGLAVVAASGLGLVLLRRALRPRTEVDDDKHQHQHRGAPGKRSDESDVGMPRDRSHSYNHSHSHTHSEDHDLVWRLRQENELLRRLATLHDITEVDVEEKVQSSSPTFSCACVDRSRCAGCSQERRTEPIGNRDHPSFF